MSEPNGTLAYLHGKPTQTAALILAAGRGNRFGSEKPKQYLEIDGVMILRRTLERFLDVPQIDLLCVVIHPDDHALYNTAIAGLDDPRLLKPTYGGPSRAATTLNGLEALGTHTPGKVLIHDAARPFVSDEIICNVLSALDTVDGAFAGLPIVDAIWRVADNAADNAVPRDGLWRAQTPQGFWFDAILNAHRNKQSDATDDVAIARAAGVKVRAILGSEDNFKITVAADLQRAEITQSLRKTVSKPRKPRIKSERG